MPQIDKFLNISRSDLSTALYFLGNKYLLKKDIEFAYCNEHLQSLLFSIVYWSSKHLIRYYSGCCLCRHQQLLDKWMILLEYLRSGFRVGSSMAVVRNMTLPWRVNEKGHVSSSQNHKNFLKEGFQNQKKLVVRKTYNNFAYWTLKEQLSFQREGSCLTCESKL